MSEWWEDRQREGKEAEVSKRVVQALLRHGYDVVEVLEYRFCDCCLYFLVTFKDSAPVMCHMIFGHLEVPGIDVPIDCRREGTYSV